MAALRARHNEGNSAVGIDRSGALRDMCAVGVVEPVTVPMRCLEAAFETTSLLLGVDERLAATPNLDPDSDSDSAATDHGGHEHAGHEHEYDSDHPGGYPWALSHYTRRWQPNPPFQWGVGLGFGFGYPVCRLRVGSVTSELVDVLNSLSADTGSPTHRTSTPFPSPNLPSRVLNSTGDDRFLARREIQRKPSCVGHYPTFSRGTPPSPLGPPPAHGPAAAFARAHAGRARSRSLATDQSGRAGALRTARTRSGLK